MNIREIVSENPVLAIMRNVPIDIVTDYAGAARNGGIRFFEVALNSKDALEEIRILRDTYKDCLIGAGTAISVDLCKKAVDAGAQFLLTPATPDPVLAYCRFNSIPLIPGVMTPSDVVNCLGYGFDTMKLFPAGNLPMKYVKSLKGPFDGTEYIAIGGVNIDNARAFIDAGCLGVGLGGDLFPKAYVKDRDWIRCEKHAEKLVNSIRGITSL